VGKVGVEIVVRAVEIMQLPLKVGVGKVGVAQVTQVISISQVTWLQYSETLLVGSSLVLLQVMQAQ
jgi:hypothetical protein